MKLQTDVACIDAQRIFYIPINVKTSYYPMNMNVTDSHKCYTASRGES